MASSLLHFGVTVRSAKYGLHLNRDTYALINPRNTFYKRFGGHYKFPSLEAKNAYADEDGTFYTTEWCEEYRSFCLKNFDLTMRYLAALDYNEFESELSSFLQKYSDFKAVTDLTDYTNIPGYYVMVLDNYSLVYIGTTTTGIRKRIQEHWHNTVGFDRLLLPLYNAETSILSIDSFRALDTTRIFAFPSSPPHDLENDFINFFSRKFISNRIGGGKLAPGSSGFLQAIASIKTKDLEGIK